MGRVCVFSKKLKFLGSFREPTVLCNKSINQSIDQPINQSTLTHFEFGLGFGIYIFLPKDVGWFLEKHLGNVTRSSETGWNMIRISQFGAARSLERNHVCQRYLSR